MENSPVPPGKGTASESRQSTRIEVSIPIVLIGKDASGREFRENTRTSVVNKHGAKVTTTHHLALETELTVENKKLGKKGKAKVVWIGETPISKDPLQIGIQLFMAENIWGIDFPPEDWQESPRKVFTRLDEKPMQPSAPEAAPPAPAEPEPEPPKIHVPPVAGSNLAEITDSIRDAADTAARDFERKLSALALAIGEQAETHIRDAVDERERALVTSTDALLRGWAEKLDAAHRDMDTLLQNVKAVQDATRRELDAAQSEIQRLTGRAVNAGLEDLSNRISKELSDQHAGLAEKISRQISEKTLEQTNKAAEEIAANSVRTVEEGARASQAAVEKEAGQLSADTLEKLRQETASILESVAGQAKDAGRLSADTLEKIREETAAMLKSAVGQTDEKIKSKLEEIEENLRAAKDKVTRSTEETIDTKAREARDAYLEDIRRQLSVLTKSTAAAMNKQAATGLDRYQSELQKKTEKELAAASEKLKKQGQDAIAEATEAFRTSMAGVFSSLSPGAKKPPKSE